MLVLPKGENYLLKLGKSYIITFLIIKKYSIMLDERNK